MIRRNRHWFVHLMSLALFCAQLGVVLHASSHLHDNPDSPAVQLCDYCVASTSLQNLAGGGTVPLFAAHIVHDPAVDMPVAAVQPDAEFTAFRSRAPPQFL